MGQVVQAIIVPEGGNLELLKEIFGEDFDKIRTDMAEQVGTSVVYTQAQKSAFESVSDPFPIGETGVKICAGIKKLVENVEKGVMPGELMSPIDIPSSPLSQVAGTQTSEYPITYGDMLWEQFHQCKEIIIGAFCQAGATVEQRQQIITAALDALRTFLDDVLGKVGTKSVAMPKVASVEGNQYGLSDMVSRMFGELRKSEKRILEQVKTAEKAKNIADPVSATGGENMSEEFVTKEDMTAAIAAAVEPISAKTDELVKAVGGIDKISEAVKGIQDTLAGKVPAAPGAVEGTTPDPKTASAEPPDPLKGVTEKLAAMEAELNAAKSKIDAFQHAGTQHVETEDAPLVRTDESGKPLFGAGLQAVLKRRGVATAQ